MKFLNAHSAPHNTNQSRTARSIHDNKTTSATVLRSIALFAAAATTVTASLLIQHNVPPTQSLSGAVFRSTTSEKQTSPLPSSSLSITSTYPNNNNELLHHSRRDSKNDFLIFSPQSERKEFLYKKQDSRVNSSDTAHTERALHQESLGFFESFLSALPLASSFFPTVISLPPIVRFAAAACPAALSSTRCSASPVAKCTMDYFFKTQIYEDSGLAERSQFCLANGADCCADPCSVHADADKCAADESCLGGGYKTFACVSKAKVCGMLSFNGTRCEGTFFCKFDSSTSQCLWSPPKPGEAGPSSSADCPALHPFVVALIALIFLTLIASVLTIAIMMVVFRRRAEEAERLEEEKHAEAAIAHTRRTQSAQSASYERSSTTAAAGGLSTHGNNNNNNNNGYASGSTKKSYTAPTAATAAPPTAAASSGRREEDDDGYGYTAPPAANASASAAEAFEIQYDDYGGYYDANGIYWDAQGNAYGADGQPMSAEAAAAAAGGGGAAATDFTFNEDDY